ncbi:ras-related protein Rab-28-like [Chelonus insularis]|uniref:ras-related protein Rab-28-like n=1 Tax=Chelonus insularis TaxID=460826 RepID=UPI00158C5F41|nr:ras-related protein Rab-28-like [Chelonus insularis]
MHESDEDLLEKQLKIVLVGDSGVGKTSIATKFCHEEFSRQYSPTSGIDFFKKTISLGPYKNVSLHFWDVSGLALHSKMLDKYLYSAKLIFLVYDVTNTSSFDILEEWITTITKINDTDENDSLMALIGNKCDVEHQRTVKRDKSHKFAADKRLVNYDMSARTGESVALTIATLAAKALGVQLTRVDQDSHKAIITAEIGDNVDMTSVQKVVKKLPNKKSYQNNNYPTLPLSKSAVCSLQ